MLLTLIELLLSFLPVIQSFYTARLEFIFSLCMNLRSTFMPPRLAALLLSRYC